MKPVTGTRFTVADYERLPEGMPIELVEAQFVKMPAPEPYHAGIPGELAWALLEHLGAVGRARVLASPVDLYVDDENVFQPDLLVLPEGERVRKGMRRVPVPVLVAEVLSPSTAARDRGAKRRGYRRAGVCELWLLDPEAETVEVHDFPADRVERTGRDGTATSRAVPGFAVPVASLFPN